MVNRYYQKHKERLQIKARERYQNLSEKKKKNKGRKKAQERYQNLTEEEKDKNTSILFGT